MRQTQSTQQNKVYKNTINSKLSRILSSHKFVSVLFIFIFATGGAIAVLVTSAATSGEIGKRKISRMTLPSNAISVIDADASLGRATETSGSGEISGFIDIYGLTDTVSLRSRTNSCEGTSKFSLWVSGQQVFTDKIIAGGWTNYSSVNSFAQGRHTVRIVFSNSSIQPDCDRRLYMDVLTVNGVRSNPTLTFSASTATVAYSQSVTLNWSGSGINSCQASGGWTGTKYANQSSSQTIGPLYATTTFDIFCRGYGGVVSRSVTVQVQEPVATLKPSVGAQEQIKSRAELVSKGLTYWTDGTAGVLKSGSTYTFYAPHSATSSKTIMKTTGSLTNPTATVKSITPQSLKSNYNYYSGGPVYRDPSTGTLLMFVHTERNVANTSGGYWSTIAMARSTDGGNTWRDVGEIISPNLPISAIPSVAQNVDVGSAGYVVIDGYFYVYFADRLAGNVSNNIAVARAKVSDVLASARKSTPTTVAWTKYYNGAWSQPGMGGLSSRLEQNNNSASFPSVSYNQYLKKYIMLVSADWPMTNLYLHISADGINWDERYPIENNPGEALYATLVGTGTNPSITDKQLYVYYVYSSKGGAQRWDDAIFARRLITFP